MKNKRFFFPLLPLAALLAGCASAPVAPPAQPAAPQAGVYGGPRSADLNLLLSAEPWQDTRAVEVYYATNRNAGNTMEACDDQAFGVEVSTEVSYGVCRTNVPRKHRTGLIQPTDDPRSDPHTYFRPLSNARLGRDEFYGLLGAGRGDVLLFIHGFNVKFEEAVMRASQIAYDLKFQGRVVLFSWPAGPPPGLLGGTLVNRTYSFNKGNAARSVDGAADLLRALAATGRTVHVVVHSMGHQVAVPALARTAADGGAPFIGELVLNAPDIPVSDFRAASKALRAQARRVTVYCSYNDNAIAASEVYNGGSGRRMGACELVDGVDVINVGEIDAPALGVGGLGHGYYASRPILTDIFQALLGVDADKRLFTRRSEVNSTENYYLRP